MDAVSRWVLTFVLNSIWQVALVAGAAALADLALRRAPARYRHSLWVVALAAAVLLPAFSMRTLRTQTVPANAAQPISIRTLSPLPASVGSAAVTRVNAGRPQPSFVQSGLALLAGAHRGIPVSRPVSRAAFILYLSFLVFMFLRFTRAWLRARSVCRLACGCPLPAHALAAIERCWRAIASGRWRRGAKPSLLWSDEISGPVTVGALRCGVVILPKRLLEEDAREDLEAALAHEMAHVCRRDYLWNLICELLLVPVAFHPLTRLVRRRLAETRELACDELATRVLDPSQYARSLVRIANEISRRTSLALKLDYTLGVFDANILEERVMTLLKPHASGRLAKVSVLLGTLVIGSSCLLASRFSLGVAPARAASAVPQDEAGKGPDLTTFAGGWQAQFEDQPFVRLKLGVQDGQIVGAIATGDVNLDNNGNVTEVSHEVRVPVPILDAKMEGDSLLFKQQDGSDTLSYQMRVTGADEAKLQMLSTGPVKIQPFTLHRNSAASAANGSNQISEYHGKLYAVSGGVSGGISGGTSGGVIGGTSAGVPGGATGGVSGGVSGSPGASSYSPTASASSEREARGQAESESNAGGLSGVVVDSSGARVPKASVWLVNRDTGARQDAETDETGGFAFNHLPAGRYTLNVMSPGMGGSFRMFTLKAEGQPPFFPFVLQPGTITESAVVTAKLPPGVSMKAGTTAGPRRIRIGGSVEGSKLIENSPQPVYPESAREHGIQGLVLLEATISADGLPTDLKVLSSPSDDLSQAAEDAVRQWRYHSTLLNGEPIAVLTTIAVDFRLEE
ncbi:MAG TPA: M56 family metallopeptidase [Terriglobia bacterium]|nr:M56 family metallopeptidase [Terriglobia bacterium]